MSLTQTELRKKNRLSGFLPCDLFKLAAGINPEKYYQMRDSQQCLRELIKESESALEREINKIMTSGSLGEPDPAAMKLLGLDDSGSSVSPSLSSKALEEIQHQIQRLEQILTENRQGLVHFAEDVDKRILSIEKQHQGTPSNPFHIKVSLEDPQRQTSRVTVEGVAHKDFHTLLTMAQAKVNILLVGPAGSGKTTGAEMVAKALGLPFYFNGAIDTEYKLKGFVDAQGRVVNTVFREAFEKGGVYLFDEVDASMPAATMAFNAALANGWCDFPDGRVHRHPDTVIIAAANTYLGGGTFEYVGRNKQDAAFVDRFVTLTWDVDESLEKALCSEPRWCDRVQRARKKAKEKGLKVIISPRASLEGAKLLKAGLTWEQVEQAAIKKGMSEEQWNSIKT